MNNEYKNGGRSSEELRAQIKRPAGAPQREDVEGIRRPIGSVDQGMGQNVRRPQNVQNVSGAQNAQNAQRVQNNANPQMPMAQRSAQPRSSAGNGQNAQVRRAVQSQGAASRGALPRQSASGAVAPKGSEAQKRRSASQSASNTRSMDRESIRRAKKSEEARKRRERDDEEENEGGGGGSAVMSLIKAILYIIIVVAVSGLLSYYIIVFVNDMYAFVKSPEEVEVTIPEYATVEEIADVLGDAGVVKYPDLLVLYAKLKKIDKTYEFIAGDYTVNGMMNYDELFYAFVEQKSYEVVRITIPEGYTVDEIITLFTENGIGSREGFVDVINNYEFDFDFVRALDEADLTGRTYRLEGYLYPDTYEFYKSSSEVTVIYKLLNRFNVIFSADFYEKAEEIGYSVDEIMTLASMIEKEARYSQDYEMVSSVFHNRLNSDNFPRLESDATIMYAIQVRDGERKSALTGEDLAYDTPYNSYLYDGLPPGPIANPGYEAITCALWPASSKYYYFVSDNYGNTYFSRTNAEHEAAKAKVEKINAGDS